MPGNRRYIDRYIDKASLENQFSNNWLILIHLLHLRLSQKEFMNQYIPVQKFYEYSLTISISFEIYLKKFNL